MGSRQKQADKWHAAAEKRGNQSFMPLRHDVLRSPVVQTLSGSAARLLLHLMAQYNGHNNGDLTATYASAGFPSKETLGKAIAELRGNGLITVSRQGGRNRCNLYAMTFLAIDHCGGKLDIDATTRPPDDWKRRHYEITPPPPLKPPDQTNATD